MSQNQFIKENRIAIVDFLRGFALLGVIISNYLAFQNSGIKDEGFNKILAISEAIFFGPVWIPLSFLFGFGFWTLIQKKENNAFIFAQRLFWLFFIALFNTCIFHLDILRSFAVLGILLLLTPYFSKRNLLFTTIFLTICIPFLRIYTASFGFNGAQELNEISHLFESDNLKEVILFNLKYTKIVQIDYITYMISIHYEIFCFFLWGVLASRFKIFENKNSLFSIAKKTLLFSIVLIGLIIGLNYLNKSIYLEISRFLNLKPILETAYALFTFSTAALIYLSGFLKKLFHFIEIYGKMTLTNYLMQSVFALLIFSGFGLGIGRNQPLWIYFVIAILIYSGQIIFSFIWLKKFRLGPVEWIWRSLSARKILPLKNS